MESVDFLDKYLDPPEYEEEEDIYEDWLRDEDFEEEEWE